MKKTKFFFHEKDIKDRWKKYFYNLLNEGYDISPDSSILDIREEDQNYSYYRRDSEIGGKGSVEKNE